MDELKYLIRIFYKSRVIISVEENQAIKTMDNKREWATNIDIIINIRTACKDFFVIKGIYILRNFIKYVVKSGYICAIISNR